ncbi:MAG: hypothetical protein LBC99_01655 [Spirochaetota bacterium]|jgi:glycosidase|nr:hypothetical protein [Spirochaetota bacterium]
MRFEWRLHYKYLLVGLLAIAALIFFLTRKDYSNYAPSLQRDPQLEAHPIGSSGFWLFSWVDESSCAESVFILGNFVSRGETITRIPMRKTDDVVWRCAVQLDPGQYAYKFLVNSKLLVPPAASQILERNMDGAGQVFVPEPDAPWIADIFPPDESTVRDFTNIRFKFNGRLNSLNTGDIRLSLNGHPIPLRFDRATASVEATVTDVPEGQYFLRISGQNAAGKSIVEYQSVFFYYKQEAARIPSTRLQGALAYRVLLSSFGQGTKSALAELISRLDYLNDGKDDGTSLGVRLLVLYGIFPAKDVWGREITSYEGVRAGYGTRALLSELASECHRRGIRLVLQINLAYLSNAHEFFQESYGNPGSKHWNWFFFLNDIGTSYLGFADDPSLPRVNTSSESVQNYILDIIRSWALIGIDGFLFEHTDLLPKVWWEKIRNAFQGIGRNDILIAASCYGGSEYINQLFQGQFNAAESLNHATDLALAFWGTRPDMISRNTAQEHAIPEGAALLKPSANHETPRLAALYRNSMRSQAALGYLLTGGGVPMLQWGDELDILSPEPPHDREPPQMPWEKLEEMQNNPNSTLHLIRKLSILRKKYFELSHDTRSGDHPVIQWAANTAGGTSVYIRQSNSERFFIAVMPFEGKDREIEPELLLPFPIRGEARYRGRDILYPSDAIVTARCVDNRVRDLVLPITPGRGFQLWLFERIVGENK